VQRRHRKQDRFLSATDHVNQAQVAFGRAFQAHLDLFKLNEVGSQQRFELILLGTPEVYLVTTHDDWDCAVNADYFRDPEGAHPLDYVKVVNIVHKYNHIALLDFELCLLVYVAAGVDQDRVVAVGQKVEVR
jgi:hypothetical protein